MRRSVFGKLLEILVYSGVTVIEKKPKKAGVIFFFFTLTFHVSKSQWRRQPLGDETECTINPECSLGLFA